MAQKTLHDHKEYLSFFTFPDNGGNIATTKHMVFRVESSKNLADTEAFLTDINGQFASFIHKFEYAPKCRLWPQHIEDKFDLGFMAYLWVRLPDKSEVIFEIVTASRHGYIGFSPIDISEIEDELIFSAPWDDITA